MCEVNISWFVGNPVNLCNKIMFIHKQPVHLKNQCMVRALLCFAVGQVSHILQRYFTSMVSSQKGPTRHAYAWQIGPFCQDTLDLHWGNHDCPSASEASLTNVDKLITWIQRELWYMYKQKRVHILWDLLWDLLNNNSKPPQQTESMLPGLTRDTGQTSYINNSYLLAAQYSYRCVENQYTQTPRNMSPGAWMT